jgi:prophage regulatory protein
MSSSVLRLPEVQKRTGKKHASIYAAIAAGTFPAPIPLGPKAVGWLSEEIDAWIAARIAERDSGDVVRSLPLAGLNQRRKIEASPQDVRDRREAAPVGDVKRSKPSRFPACS